MRASCIWIVVQEDVAFVYIVGESFNDFSRGIGDGEDMDRVVRLALRDQAAVGGDQTAGEIMPLIDDRGIGTADHIGPHLVHHGDERLADEFQAAKFVHSVLSPQ